MSRLQVGGLALIISDESCKTNEGRVVELVSRGENLESNCIYGKGVFPVLFEVACKDGLLRFDGVFCFDGDIWYEPKDLMPLGDKQTQNELAKEKEVEWI